MTDNRSRAELLTALEQRAQIITSPEEMAALEFDWSFWGRPKQHAPAGNWSNWLILAGRGFGKTLTGAEWVRQNMCGDTPLTGGKWRRIAIIAETAADARDVMVGDGTDLAFDVLANRPTCTGFPSPAGMCTHAGIGRRPMIRSF